MKRSQWDVVDNEQPDGGGRFGYNPGASTATGAEL